MYVPVYCNKKDECLYWKEDKMSEYTVEMRNINKSFGDVHAVKDGEFFARKGEIHSLIGENGAGKSTLMKLLFGMYPVDSGEIIVNGKLMERITPTIAFEHKIGMVHQEFMLVKELSVLENIILGAEPKKGVTIDFAKARKEIEKYIVQYKMSIQLDKKVSQISVGEAQRVEIIKTLMRGVDFIIFDEPTAVLTPQESIELFKILRNLKEDGKTIVFISHKLNEVMEISDRITVMRQGEFMGTVIKEETSPIELTKMMIGRDVFLSIDKTHEKAGEPVLEVEDIWVSSNKETSKIRGMSFKVHAGEIVGVAGIDGNGQSELVEALVGRRKVEKGAVRLCGENVTNKSTKRIRRTGLSVIPEDRNIQGLSRQLTVKDNLVSASLDKSRFTKGVFINKEEINNNAKQQVKDFDIRPIDFNRITSTLSGGNAQKVVVAREVRLGEKVLIAAQPTRGVDVGAIEIIRNTIEAAKKEGTGVLLVSAELDEIISLSDRILVIHEGSITGELEASEANENNLGLLMMGGTSSASEEGVGEMT